MHLIVIAVVALIIIYILVNNQNRAHQANDDSVVLPLSVEQPTGDGHRFVFISKGKLFIKTDANEVEQIHSPYVQEMIDRMERKKQLHGWKENTTLNTSFTGRAGSLAADQVELQVVSAQFSTDNKLIYFLKDSHVGGLFEFDAVTKSERRLLHKQNLFYENLTVNRDNGKLLCSQQQANGIANIVMLSEDGGNSRQLTEGDTVDSSPAWIPGDENKLLYQSSGIARSEEGYVIAHGPSSLKLLDMDNGNVMSIREDANFDFLQPRVDGKGNLYFIKRPYEAQKYGGSVLLLDFLLFPFRLMRAVFHYLNFFSLMYSRKPLTTASGPQVNADIKDILIKGKRIDADKALRKESRVNGIPSLVPKSWQLIRRTLSGEELILATNVCSFDISSNDEILYSNGYAVFQLQADKHSKVILRNKLIADIVAS